MPRVQGELGGSSKGWLLLGTDFLNQEQAQSIGSKMYSLDCSTSLEEKNQRDSRSRCSFVLGNMYLDFAQDCWHRAPKTQDNREVEGCR